MDKFYDFIDSKNYTDRTSKVLREAYVGDTSVQPSITSTYLFSVLNDVNGGTLTAKMLSVANSESVSEDKLPINMIEMKNYKLPKKDEVLGLLGKGKIMMKYDTKVLNKLNNSIPVVLTAAGGELKASVNITNQCIVNKDGDMKIQSITLYALLNSGYIHLLCMNNFRSMQYNYKLLEYGALCYSKIFANIFIKRHSINTMPAILDTVSYLAAKFFLLHIFRQKYTEHIGNIAKKCTRGMNDAMQQSLDAQIPEECFHTLTDFYTKLIEVVPQIAKTSLRDFIFAFVNTYGDSTLFAIEWLPAFLTMISNVQVGSFLNKKLYIENITQKSGDLLFETFMKI